jgi:hypothetical protein
MTQKVRSKNSTKKNCKHQKNTSDEKRKSKGCWYRFTQQQLPAWQPVLTPKCVVFSFYLLAAVM